MTRFRRNHYLLCFVLLFGVLGGLFGGQVVFAAQESSNDAFLQPPNQEQPPPSEPSEEELVITSKYPVIRAESGGEFEFEVSLSYKGNEPKIFELTLTSPPEWQAFIKPRFEEKEAQSVLAIRLESGREYPETVKAIVSPLPGALPEPGDYVFAFEAYSDNLRESFELKGIITEVPFTYELDVTTVTGRLDTLAKAGEDKTISLKLTNSGTGVIEDITFSSAKSEGWGITFTPSKIESLKPGISQEVDVVITPPSKTIAGDYSITLSAKGTENASDSVGLRVSVQTPTIWGGAGIGIVVAVVAGLVFLFRRLGRR